MRLRKQRKALSIIDGQTGRSITEQHSPFPLLEVNRTTPQHEAINADHCAAQWLYTVSLTPPRCSQRSNMHCPSPAAEQSRPLLPNIQGLGQGSLGTTKLETKAHKCGKENETHSHEGPSHHSTLTSQTIKLLDFPFISPLRICGDALHRFLLMSFLLPWGKVCPSLRPSLNPSFSGQSESARRSHSCGGIAVDLALWSSQRITDTDLSPQRKQGGRQSKFEAAGYKTTMIKKKQIPLRFKGGIGILIKRNNKKT